MKVVACMGLTGAALFASAVAAAPGDAELLKRATAQAVFVEMFDDVAELADSRWRKSSHEKYAAQDVALGEYTVPGGDLEKDLGLVLNAPAKHYGVAVKLDEPLVLDGSAAKQELVVQYEVKLQTGLSCGGAYVKLLRQNADDDYAAVSNDSPFVLMFGPDKCGANDKVHFIFQHRSPATGAYEEKHMDEAPQSKADRLTHLYTLVLRDDNTFEMRIDQQVVAQGSLFDSFTPPVLPDPEIDDPADVKPADWVEDAQIRDPDARKPADWDEDAPARLPDEAAERPADWLEHEAPMIPDPAVAKPEDWDDEDDGEFVAPEVPNPKCAAVSGCGPWTPPTKANPLFKGKWTAPLVRNPLYQGEWAPRRIPNPDFFEDAHPARLDPIGALAVEVWTMSEGIAFDNFWLGHDLAQAEAFANATFAPKHARELAEQEHKRALERKELEEKRARQESYWYQLTDGAASLLEYAEANPVRGYGSIFLITVFTLVLSFVVCCGRASEEEEDVAEGEALAAKPTDSSPATESEGEGKKTLRQRKKAPVVKDD